MKSWRLSLPHYPRQVFVLSHPGKALKGGLKPPPGRLHFHFELPKEKEMSQNELRKVMEEINPHVRSVVALLVYLSSGNALKSTGLPLATEVTEAYKTADLFIEQWYQDSLGDE